MLREILLTSTVLVKHYNILASTCGNSTACLAKPIQAIAPPPPLFCRPVAPPPPSMLKTLNTLKCMHSYNYTGITGIRQSAKSQMLSASQFVTMVL